MSNNIDLETQCAEIGWRNDAFAMKVKEMRILVTGLNGMEKRRIVGASRRDRSAIRLQKDS